jgi:hypothetical protein
VFANLISHRRKTEGTLTAKQAWYSEDEEPLRAEKEQMSATQEEFIHEKPQLSKSKEK